MCLSYICWLVDLRKHFGHIIRNGDVLYQAIYNIREIYVCPQSFLFFDGKGKRSAHLNRQFIE